MTEEKLPEVVMTLVCSGQTVRAINELRQETCLGLKETKHIVDREIAAHRRNNPNAQVNGE